MNRRLLLLIFLPLSIVRVDAQWLDPTGPTGGEITALVSTRNGLYAGTSAGGALRTTDGGGFWREVNQGGLVPERVMAMASDDSALYVATDGGIEANEFGDLWFHDDSRGFDINAEQMIVSLQSVGWATFAGTRIGLYRHRNGAFGWALMDSTRYLGSARTLVQFGDRLVAGFESRGVRLSLDSGQQWRVPA